MTSSCGSYGRPDWSYSGQSCDARGCLDAYSLDSGPSHASFSRDLPVDRGGNDYSHSDGHSNNSSYSFQAQPYQADKGLSSIDSNAFQNTTKTAESTSLALSTSSQSLGAYIKSAKNLQEQQVSFANNFARFKELMEQGTFTRVIEQKRQERAAASQRDCSWRGHVASGFESMIDGMVEDRTNPLNITINLLEEMKPGQDPVMHEIGNQIKDFSKGFAENIINCATEALKEK